VGLASLLFEASITRWLKSTYERLTIVDESKHFYKGPGYVSVSGGAAMHLKWSYDGKSILEALVAAAKESDSA
jgi:hypothetical protein